MKEQMKKLKKPLRFTLIMMPIIVIATIFVVMYQIDQLSKEMIDEMIHQLGSRENVIIAMVIQTTIITLVCSFFGYILSNQLGLWRPFRLEKSKISKTVIVSILAGVAMSLDYWTFGRAVPLIQEGTEAAVKSYQAVIASLLYGGVNEELMLRLFVLSLIAFLVWKGFYRKNDRENIPEKVYIFANVIAAVLFAMGHIPATIQAIGALTPIILIRCFLFNGGFGYLFGRFYYKYGIWYAMLSHMLVHTISKLIWYFFI